MSIVIRDLLIAVVLVIVATVAAYFLVSMGRSRMEFTCTSQVVSDVVLTNCADPKTWTDRMKKQ